jgi:phenylacetate-CoA ligase
MRSLFYSTLLRYEDLLKNEKTAFHYKRLKGFMDADPEFLEGYKLEALKRLLEHAYANVPYYRRKFDEMGAKPEDIESLADFSNFPVLTREDIKSNCDDLISRTHDKSKLKSGYTSGSSGTPMIYYHDGVSYSAGKAALLVGWELAGKRMGDRVVTIWGGQDTVTKKWAKMGSRLKAKLYRNTRIPVYVFSDARKIGEAIELMQRQKNGFVYGYTNTIYTIANYAKENNLTFEPKFEGVLTTAESLYPHHRKVIEDVLGETYDGFGCQEIQGIAFQCQEKKGYHIVEPNVIFETEGFSGDTRELIVTDLWNYAWPLIRCKNGDLVRGELGRCACGCTWRKIEAIEGRATDILTAPDGTIIYFIVWLVVEIFNYFPVIKQFQWAKVADDKLVLRLMLHEEPEMGFKNKVLSHFGPYFEDKIGFDIEFVNGFDPGPSGKHKPVVDETK